MPPITSLFSICCPATLIPLFTSIPASHPLPARHRPVLPVPGRTSDGMRVTCLCLSASRRPIRVRNAPQRIMCLVLSERRRLNRPPPPQPLFCCAVGALLDLLQVSSESPKLREARVTNRIESTETDAATARNGANELHTSTIDT